MKGNAVLFSEMTLPADREDAFNHWSDTRQFPDHVDRVPGMLSAVRYRSTAGPHYLAVYELESPAVLDSADYLRCADAGDDETRAILECLSGVTRYVAAEAFCSARGDVAAALEAQVIHCVFFRVPLERTAEFDDWFDNEHVPLVLTCADWLMARRLDVVAWDPEPCSHLILHYLAGESALDSEALRRARASDRRQRLAAESWFAPLSVTYHRRGQRYPKSG